MQTWNAKKVRQKDPISSVTAETISGRFDTFHMRALPGTHLWFKTWSEAETTDKKECIKSCYNWFI